MITFYVIVTNPVVVLVHIMALALTQPDLRNIAALLLRADLVVAQETSRLGEVALGAVREAPGGQAVLCSVPQIERSSVGGQTQD